MTATEAPEPTPEPTPEQTAVGAVTVAYVHQNEVAYSWHHSMTELLGYDWANHGRVLRGGYIGMRYGSDGLVQARNKAISHFLDDGKADWLFWIDTDMGFPADAVDRLLAAADPTDRPIVGGLCFTQTETASDGMGGWRCHATPTVFDWAKVGDQLGWAVRWDVPANTLIRVGGTGSACILIHRSVFERIEAAHGRVWYDRVPNTTTGQLIGEDLSLCLRAGAMGIPIHLHTGVRTTHLKAMWLADDDYRAQRRIAPPPATETVAVVVPVLRRPANAAPFMATLRATTGMATVYAICDRDDPDTAAAWRAAGAVALELDTYVSAATGQPFTGRDRPGSFAEKVNIGYRHSDEPWVFVTGDDVRFHPGWLDHAQAAAGGESGRYHVIGTNDLGNARVTSGEHATHLLIRRSYVDELGASWDGPKVVAHEGYRHWYVDDEIVMAAKQRGVWTPELHAIVEHFHPAWGKAADDEVYQLGQSHADADRARFAERCRVHLLTNAGR